MSTTVSLEVRVLPIASLTPAPYNPRKLLRPTDAAYRKLRASLTEFGLVEPLIWNEETGHVVGGHARLRILRELGFTEVPVSVVRLSAAREKALNVVLNNQEAQGRYDPEKLAGLLTELRDLPELELTGFDESTLATLRYEPAEPNAEEAHSEDVVEITIRTTAEVYVQLEPELNDLVMRFDLETHVHHGGDTSHSQ